MKLLTLLLLLLSFNFSWGQSFTNLYSGNQPLTNYEVTSVCQTAADGYILLANDYNQHEAHIINLDLNGDTLWTKKFFINISSKTGTIQELPDGSFIMSHCYIAAYQRITHLDANGNELWTRQIYKSGDLNIADETGVRYDPTSGGVYNYFAYCSLGSAFHPSVVKLNSGGATIWTKSFSDIFGSIHNVEVRDAQVNANGDLVMIFESAFSNYIAMIDGVTGDVIELIACDMTLNSIEVLTSTDLMVAGAIPDVYGNFDAGFITLDGGNLSEVDNGSFGSSNYESVTDIEETQDGTIALAVVDNSTGDSKMAIYKLSSSNTLDWARAYGGSGTDEGLALFQKPDLGYFIAGNSNSFTPTGDILALSVDENGVGEGCQEDLLYTTVTNSGFILGDVTPQNVFPTFMNQAASISIVNDGDLTILKPVPISNIVATEPLCNAGTGSADLQLSGGVVPYAYNWSSGTSSEDLAGVFAGQYEVQIEDNAGCKIQDTVIINEPTALSSTISSIGVSCAGAADGSINLTASGGMPTYSYQWSYLGQTSEDLTGIPGGFYFVSITDNNGCITNQAISVTEPSPLIVAVFSTNDPLCTDDCDGNIGVSATGGTGAYNYDWNDQSNQTTSNATNLCAGTYLVNVSDVNGCSTFLSHSLSNPAPLDADILTTSSSCGLGDGTAQAVVNGGTGAYIYDWPSGSVSSTDNGLKVGSYSVLITDDNDCEILEEFIIDPYTETVDICIVTVDSSSSKNIVVWEKPIADNIEGFNIYRNIAGSYDQVGYVPYADLSQFTDLTFGVDPNITSYRYKVSVVDTCGYEGDLSDFHESIHLTSSVGVGGEVNLIWDNYEGFNFVNYAIQKDTTDNGLNDYYDADFVSSNNFTWTDLNPQNYSTYSIVVLSPGTCSATLNKATDYNSSRSNKADGAKAPETNSLNELKEEQFKIYPNPSNGIFSIEYDSNLGESLTIEVYDFTGRLIWNQPNTVFEFGAQKINLTYLAEGNYLVKLRGVDDQTITKQITIIK